jgi:lipocalin
MNYLWILSRKPVLEEREMKQLVYFCGENGFAADDLIFPKQK